MAGEAPKLDTGDTAWMMVSTALSSYDSCRTCTILQWYDKK